MSVGLRDAGTIASFALGLRKHLLHSRQQDDLKKWSTAKGKLLSGRPAIVLNCSASVTAHHPGERP